NVDFLSTGFFYKSLFGFDIQPSQDLPDIHGLVVSRTATNKDKSIRIPINMTNARSASAERFLTQTRGSGVQQIAFACDDIFTAAKNMDQEKVLTIPNNYYRDIEARFDLSEELIAKLKAYNILFDRNDQGEFFHFYTEQMHGVFFEVVQRVDGYDNYGEANAFVRLAAQAEQEKA
ncbi:MAG: sugar phosphate isomerase/epimerase and 4-hydroxyphenylpyruvate domain-containing protein, partial [Marinomonas sp.]